MVGMLLIGYFAYKRTSNHSDYMLGGRSLGPAVTALSAGAADMSGWLLMGLPGSMFSTGLSASWIAIGLTIGAYINWIYTAPRLRAYTEIANNSITIPSFLENRFSDKSKLLRIFSSLVILVFFTFYVSSGMVSGGVLFNSILGLDYHTGLWIVAGVVVAYTLFGGFLAVSWTDFVQGVIMVVALILVPIVAFINTGGPSEAFGTIQSIDPKLLDIFRGTSVLGIISLLAWGLGYFGQPHIIVRFMAISSVKEVKNARRIGMGWMAFSVVGALLSGLIGMAYYSQNGLELKDPETIFIQLGNILFHPLITGFIISAILAAVMSTISSQLLVTASSLTEDIYKSVVRKTPSEKTLILLGRLSVLFISVIALILAWEKNSTILDLVGYAWAGFGAAFGPVIILSLCWNRMNAWGALAGMVTGALTVIIWSNTGLSKVLYEIVPGFAVSMLFIFLVSSLTSNSSASVQNEFEKYKAML
jgi:sodium/proline symporter